MTNTNTITLELSREEFELVRRAIRAQINDIDKRYDELCDRDLDESIKDKHLATLSRHYRFASAFEGTLEDIARDLKN